MNFKFIQLQLQIQSYFYFLEFLGGVKFRYVVLTIRCIYYTCAVSSGISSQISS